MSIRSLLQRVDRSNFLKFNNLANYLEEVISKRKDQISFSSLLNILAEMYEKETGISHDFL